MIGYLNGVRRVYYNGRLHAVGHSGGSTRVSWSASHKRADRWERTAPLGWGSVR